MTRTPPLARPGAAIWGPFVAVMLVLGALAVAPLATSAHVRRLRGPLNDGAEPALVHVNDLEASLAAELYASAEWARTGDSTALRRWREVAADEAHDIDTLALLVRRIDAPSSRAFTDVVIAIDRWHAATPPRDGALGLAALDASQRLEYELERFADARRRDLRRWSQLDVWTAIALVPLAVIGVGVLAWTSWRMASLTRLADAQRDELVSAARSRETLLRGVSHDLRNPLGAAAAYLDMLGTGEYGELDPSHREPIRRAERLVRSALQTTGDLLDLARADAGQLPVRGVPVALDALVGAVVDDHAAAATRAGLTLAMSVAADHADTNADTSDDPTWLELSTDPERVRQVLANLLSNAIKYTPRGGSVEVRIVRRHGGDPTAARLAIEVRDTGPGIPLEHRERVFEEAVRLPSARHVAPGAGIGLAAARRVARALGGELTAGEAPGGGAAFTLTLGGGTPTAITHE